MLGACVPPSVADGYCGPIARATATGGCAFPACGTDEAVDVDRGCIPLPSLHTGGPRACGKDAALVVEDSRLACVPADAACPAGTHAAGSACVHSPDCPPGTLFAAGSCQPIVQRGVHGAPRVELPAWTVLVFGVDGGPGSPELCRPLQSHPFALGLTPGDELTVRLHVALSVPDDDITRVSAQVTASSPHTLTPAASTLAEQAVARLLEPLRGLGGEASTSRVDVSVECLLATPRP